MEREGRGPDHSFPERRLSRISEGRLKGRKRENECSDGTRAALGKERVVVVCDSSKNKAVCGTQSNGRSMVGCVIMQGASKFCRRINLTRLDLLSLAINPSQACEDQATLAAVCATRQGRTDSNRTSATAHQYVGEGEKLSLHS